MRTLIDKVVQAAKCLGHHETLRASTPETIEYWQRELDKAVSGLMAEAPEACARAVWTLEVPTEPGWYWLKVPEDYPRTALRDVPPALVHLHVRHGLHYYEGRLSGEVPGHWGFTRDPMDVTTMEKIGIKFHGPIRAPE